MDFLKFWAKKIFSFRPQGENNLPLEQMISRYEFMEIVNDLLWNSQRESVEDLMKFLKRLPKALVMTLGPAHFRAVIIRKSNAHLVEICARDFSWRHPREKLVPMKKIPLAKEVLNKGVEVYIDNPASHPWTREMKQLVHDQQINAIFAVPIFVNGNIFALVVDATHQQQGIDKETKKFLRRVAVKIEKTEKGVLRFQNVKKTEIGQRRASSMAILFLGEIAVDSLRNKVSLIGGLSNHLSKNGPCPPKLKIILKEIQRMENSLNIVGQVLHDIKMGEKINLEYFQVNQIFSHLSSAGVICRPAPTLKIYSDRRKLEKLLKRITGLFQGKNKNPVCLRVEDSSFSWRFIFKQRGLDTTSLGKILRIAQTGETVGFKVEDLPLICSVNLLMQELGGEIEIKKNKVIVKIPKEP